MARGKRVKRARTFHLQFFFMTPKQNHWFLETFFFEAWLYSSEQKSLRLQLYIVKFGIWRTLASTICLSEKWPTIQRSNGWQLTQSFGRFLSSIFAEPPVQLQCLLGQDSVAMVVSCIGTTSMASSGFVLTTSQHVVKIRTSWVVFHQPIWKICKRQIGFIFPKFRGEHKKVFETTI